MLLVAVQIIRIRCLRLWVPMTVSHQPLMSHSTDKGPSPKSGIGMSGAAPAPAGPSHSTEEIHEAEVLLSAENLLLPYWPFLQTET